MGRKTKTLDERRAELSTEHRGLLVSVFLWIIFDHQKEMEAKQASKDAPRPLFLDGAVKWSPKRYLGRAVSPAESALWSRRMKLLSDLGLVHKEGNLVRLTKKGRATLQKLYVSDDFIACLAVKPFYPLLLADYKRDQSEAILEAIEIAKEHGGGYALEGLNDLYQRLTSPFNIHAEWLSLV